MQYDTGERGHEDGVMGKGGKPFDIRYSFLNYKVAH